MELTNKKGIITFNLLSLTIMTMSVFLNQTAIIGQVNISFADFFAFTIFIMLLINRNLIIPFIPTLFYIVISISVLFTATYVVPDIFLYNPNLRGIVINYTKLLVTFIYFIIGYNIARTNYINKTLKWYSHVSLIIGMIGIIFTFLNIRLFSSTLFFAGTRYDGLMNDPNYFSIIQLSALVYFTRSKISLMTKYISFTVIVTSILLSGSKTGFIALGFYLLYRIIFYLFSNKSSIWTKIIQILSGILTILIFSNFLEFISKSITSISKVIPAFGRIQLLIYNFSEAISAGGSDRSMVWSTAIKVISNSPLFGVGVGTYGGVATRLVGSDAIAHNTYLQLSAEWGLVLAIIFFIGIALIIGKITLSSKKSESIIILNDIIIIFLVGSIGISLNNARMFWLFLGALIFLKTIENYDKETT